MQRSNIYVSLDIVRLEHIWVLTAESLKGTLRENHPGFTKRRSWWLKPNRLKDRKRGGTDDRKHEYFFQNVSEKWGGCQRRSHLHDWDDVPLRLICWALKRAWWLRELELWRAWVWFLAPHGGSPNPRAPSIHVAHRCTWRQNAHIYKIVKK